MKRDENYPRGRAAAYGKEKLRATRLIRVDEEVHAHIANKKARLLTKNPLATMNDALRELIS